MTTQGANQQAPLPQQLLKQVIENVFRQAAANQAPEEDKGGIKIDPDTLKRITEREVRMATDAEFELNELAKEAAAQSLRDKLKARTQPLPAAPPADKTADKEKRDAAEQLKLELQRIDQQTALYTSCISHGGDPKTCGELVEKVYGTKKEVSAPQATSITDLVHALKELDDMRGSNKTDPALMDILKAMREETLQLRAGGGAAAPKPPSIGAQLQELNTLLDGFVKLGVAVRKGDIPAGGESMEVVKEKNRHDEKLAELKNNKDHNDQIAQVLTDIPQRLGEGAGEFFMRSAMEGDNAPAKKTAPAASTPAGKYVCQNQIPEKEGSGAMLACNTEIAVPAGAGTIECPKCHMVYKR